MICKSALFSSVSALFENSSLQLARGHYELFNKLYIVKIGCAYAKCHVDKRLPFVDWFCLPYLGEIFSENQTAKTANVCRHGILRRCNQFWRSIACWKARYVFLPAAETDFQKLLKLTRKGRSCKSSNKANYKHQRSSPFPKNSFSRAVLSNKL